MLEQSAVGAVLATLDALSCFAASAYFCPRVEPDGGRACLRRCDKDHLEVQAERILLAAHKLCLRADCDAFSGILDVPNTHRFRELLFPVVDTLDHTGDLLELPLEGFLHSIKRSITRGNRHDDDGYVLRRYVEQEAIP